MQNQTNRANTLRSFIPRGTQIGFIAGLLLGILLGWMFSGVVGAVMRLGFLAIVLFIFLAAVLFWWNMRRASQSEGPTVYTWSSTSISPPPGDFRDTGMPNQDTRPQDVIDLEELKKQIERERES